MSFITRALRPLRRPAPPSVKSSDVSYGMYLDAAGNLTALKAGSYTNELAATRNITGDTEGLAAAYMASVWAYRCVNVRAQAVSRVPYRVFNKKTGDEIPGHPLTRAILAAPSLLRRWEWSLGIWGETFVELMRNRIGNVAGLKWLNPLGVVVDTTNGRINQFQYSSINGGRFVTFEPQEIVFSRFDNPVDDLRGMSPFITVLDELGIDRAMSRVIRMYYANDTRLGMLLIPDRDLNDSDQQKFMAFWNANYKGSKNAGKAALMPFGLRAERVQNQPNEDDTNLRTVIKQEVCAAFGVPAILVGTGDVATYQNTDAQMQFFSENTVIPECLMIAGDINRQALPYFDNSGDAEFEFIIDDILALSDASRKKADMQNSRLATGGITLNEYRESLGMKPIPTGEVLYVPSGSVPIPLADLGKPLMAPPSSLPAASPFGLPQLPKLPERVATPAQPQQPDRPAEPTPTGKAEPWVDAVALQDGYFAELSAWERKALNKGAVKAATFTCDTLPEYYADPLRKALTDLPAEAMKADIRGVFATVKQTIEATPEDALAYWARYDRLLSQIGTAWIDDYMTRVADAVLPGLSPDMAEAQLDDALAQFRPDLMAVWMGTQDNPGPLLKLALAGLAAGQEAMDRNRSTRPPGKAELGIDWYLLSKEAFDFLRDYMFGLVSRLDDTTREQLRAVIQTWAASGQGLDKLKQDIETIIRNPVRARLIAQTESTRVFNEGAFQRYENAGVYEGDWITVNDGVFPVGHVCTLCNALSLPESNPAPFRVGWTYQGKVYRPPAHPGCRCFTRPRV